MKNKHPEQFPDEIFIGNWFNHISFLNDVSWNTKREGDVAYDENGKVILMARPVFIKRAEVEKVLENTTYEDVRKALKDMLENGCDVYGNAKSKK